MNGRSRSRRIALLLAFAVVGFLARARKRASEVPLSPVTAGWFVGADFVQRQGIATAEQPAGELDDISVLAGDSFDPAHLDPAIQRFYERTAEYDLCYRVRWHTPFRTGAALASRVTSRIEQLNLPGPGDESWHRMESAFLTVDEPGAVAGSNDGDFGPDPENPAREDVRAWVRTDPETGAAVFVALYATHHRDGEGFVNITAPVLGGGIDTVLRPAHLGRGEKEEGQDGAGIRLTTRGAGDPGLYLRTPFGAFAVPGGQAFDVWRDGDELRATHEMWLLGRPFLTVEYEIRHKKRR